MTRSLILSALLLAGPAAVQAAPDQGQEILVTFENSGASPMGGIRAPYRARKRYAISVTARRDSSNVEREFNLTEVDHWPIRSLGVYCFVYRIAESADLDDLLTRLRADDRVESAQVMNEFRPGTMPESTYNDTYIGLQHGFAELGLDQAHRVTLGEGIRVAVIDSNADREHEDLQGQIQRLSDFTSRKAHADLKHGTAVASVIAANANNDRGIAGVAPGAEVDLLVACWAAADRSGATCSSFTLAKALDSIIDDPPDVLNMSIIGPGDALLERLIDRLVDEGVIAVAADGGFPADLPNVLSAAPSGARNLGHDHDHGVIFAPGDQILVAVPDNQYEFQSGSSLAAAHLSGVVALLLAIAPELDTTEVASIMSQARGDGPDHFMPVQACSVIALARAVTDCGKLSGRLSRSELESQADREP